MFSRSKKFPLIIRTWPVHSFAKHGPGRLLRKKPPARETGIDKCLLLNKINYTCKFLTRETQIMNTDIVFIQNVQKGGMVGNKNSSHANSFDPADVSLVLRPAVLLNSAMTARRE